MLKNKIKVLVVDDSAVVRSTLSEILRSDPDIEIMATAADPFIASDKIKHAIPDVITMDIEMPRMDGITFLHKIMSQHPIPVVMCSSLTEKGCKNALKAIEYGAVDIIQKPKMGAKQFLEESRIKICDSIKAASRAKVKKISGARRKVIEPKLTADAVLAKGSLKSRISTTEKIVVIGASTGGTEALKKFLESLPIDTPGIVIVQHMPEGFTKAFSNRLNTQCSVNVKEAENNDKVIRGRALISPGNKHMLLKRSGSRYYVELKDGPLVSRHRPSVDVLFRSASRYAGKNIVGVIMTGMGDDGAKGMLEMKEAGAINIAQDEKSCIVFGMPNEAIKLGGVDKIVSLDKISTEVLKLCI